MVPAHHLLDAQLIGCPDPNPASTGSSSLERNRLGSDLTTSAATTSRLWRSRSCRWLDRIEPQAPIGVLFSGGIDGSAVFLAAYSHQLLKRGESPARLKCFTLTVEGARTADQARAFLNELGLGLFLETVAVPLSALDYREAIRVIEDYKPLDVQAATMGLALCREIRRRYPAVEVSGRWRRRRREPQGLSDRGEPRADDPQRPEQSAPLSRGLGAGAVKHSLTYSEGQSRGHVRSSALAGHVRLRRIQPLAPAERDRSRRGIPFIELTGWGHEKLYSLKGRSSAAGSGGDRPRNAGVREAPHPARGGHG